MLKVGMIGEYPTDIECIKCLLLQQYPEVDFFPLLYDIHGSMLENQGVKRRLRIIYEIERPNYVLFIRDLDGHSSDKILMDKKKEYFKNFNGVVDRKGFLLLNIQELEAILLSNVDVLNKYYNARLNAVMDCMLIPSPKEFIGSNIKGYSTGDNIKLFRLYDVSDVRRRCRFFNDFIDMVDPFFSRN